MQQNNSDINLNNILADIGKKYSQHENLDQTKCVEVGVRQIKRKLLGYVRLIPSQFRPKKVSLSDIQDSFLALGFTNRRQLPVVAGKFVEGAPHRYNSNPAGPDLYKELFIEEITKNSKGKRFKVYVMTEEECDFH